MVRTKIRKRIQRNCRNTFVKKTLQNQDVLEELVLGQEAYPEQSKKEENHTNTNRKKKEIRDDVPVFLSAQQNKTLEWHSMEHEKQMYHQFACYSLLDQYEPAKVKLFWNAQYLIRKPILNSLKYHTNMNNPKTKIETMYLYFSLDSRNRRSKCIRSLSVTAS